jgi:hypothetical protein
VNRASSKALIVTTLLFGAVVHAQDAPAPVAPAAPGCKDSNQPACLSIATEPNLELPAKKRTDDPSSAFRLFGNVKGFGLFETDIARTTWSFGQTWQLKTGIRYEAPGGVQFSASVIGRRGYSLPIAMMQPLGSDVQVTDPSNTSLLFGAAPIQWDTELRVRKTFISSDAMDLAGIAEVFNLVNVNRGVQQTEKTPLLISPTIRAGVLVGF